VVSEAHREVLMEQGKRAAQAATWVCPPGSLADPARLGTDRPASESLDSLSLSFASSLL